MKEKPQKIMHIKDETWKIAEYSAKAKKHKWNTVDCDFFIFLSDAFSFVHIFSFKNICGIFPLFKILLLTYTDKNIVFFFSHLVSMAFFDPKL